MFKKNESYVFSAKKYIAWAKQKEVKDFIIEMKLDMLADGTPVQIESPSFGYCQRSDYKDKKTEIIPLWCDTVKQKKA